MYLKCWGTRGSLPRALDNQKVSELIKELAETSKKSGATTIDEFIKHVESDSFDRPLTYGGSTTCSERSAMDLKSSLSTWDLAFGSLEV